jgi:hypothetical protein
VTLGDGFASPGTIMADGAGTLDNRTTLSGSGTIIGQSISTATGLVVNDGAIISSITGITPAVSLYMSAFTNNGTITATGNGAAASGGLTNSGTITAVGTAVSAPLTAGTFANSGTITSTGRHGAYASGNISR